MDPIFGVYNVDSSSTVTDSHGRCWVKGFLELLYPLKMAVYDYLLLKTATIKSLSYSFLNQQMKFLPKLNWDLRKNWKIKLSRVNIGLFNIFSTGVQWVKPLCFSQEWLVQGLTIGNWQVKGEK